MKHQVTTIVCIVLITIGGVVAYQEYKTNQTSAFIKKVRADTIQAAKDSPRRTVVDDEKAKIKAACDNETKFYNGLTPKQQLTVAAPNCNLQMVE